MKTHFANHHGTTLFEVLTAMTLIAVVGAVVTTLIALDDSGQTSEVETIKNHLRYAQIMALSNNEYSWKVTFSSNPPDAPDSLPKNWEPPYSYYYFSRINPTDGTEKTIPLPNEDSKNKDYQAEQDSHDYVILGMMVTPDAVFFDEWGIPVDAAGIPLASDKILTRSADGNNIVTITRTTGFIE